MTEILAVVLGGQGVLGKTLGWIVQQIRVDGPHIAFLGKEDCDITDSNSLAETMALYQPETVVNLAAVTNVGYCEKNPEAALRVNAVGAGKAALAARMADADFVQISTDYVFPGYDGPASVDDVPLPINAYGLSKRWGEQAVAALHPGALIMRVGWLFGADYPSCPPMLALSENYEVEVNNVQAKHRASIWNDLVGNPTHVADLANRILDFLVIRKALRPDRYDIWHFASSEPPISWYDLLVNYFPDIRGVSGQSWSGVKRPQKGGLIPSGVAPAWSYERAMKMFFDELRFKGMLDPYDGTG